MDRLLSKVYTPKDIESKIYKFWEDNNYFHVEVDKKKKPYTIVMPPPNITGNLHMGHALDETLQDVLIRFKRMQGYCALWVPGVDHSAIATEVKIIEKLKALGTTKHEIGREKFLEYAWEWKEKYSNIIVNQVKKLGASCDWSRNRFTLDEGCSKAVVEFFVRLYEKGLIYRGEKIINWCPHCMTSLSDSEVTFKETDGHFWHVKYRLSDSTDFLVVATTRPETILGDTAIAVNPNDERYKNYIGKEVIVPLVNRKIPIIADEYVEQDFGTGVLKITPAHDHNDFEVGRRHKLPIINIFDDKAIMNDNTGVYKGLDRYEARKKIVEDLKSQSYIVKIEDIKHNVGTCYRCSTHVEPKISIQWFVKTKQLAQPAIECVKSKKTNFIPNRFSKIYYHWMENIEDWCISRQIWWGHSIPAWYCDKCNNMMVSRNKISKCDKCGSTDVHQDTDTLDTWFSSALWPFSVLGWPEKTPELEFFFPTDTLVTGYDIIFFWVAKMIFSSMELLGKEPFKKILIHGLLRDAQGRKMSKSLGNGIDPLKIVDEFGADSLRFSLLMGNSPGNDMRFSEEKISSSRNFMNKIWNAHRFILMNIDDSIDLQFPKSIKSKINMWIVSRCNDICREVTENIEKFEIGIALQKLYDFVWDEFCDWYIEFSKLCFKDNDDISIETKSILVNVMLQILKLLHPFIPFITEQIYQNFPHDCQSIMISEYPVYNPNFEFKSSVDFVNNIIKIVKAIRNRRSEMNVPQGKKTLIYMDIQNFADFEQYRHILYKLCYAKDIIFGNDFKIPNAVTIVTDVAKIYIPMDELIDKNKESERLNKELQSLLKQFSNAKDRLNNPDFVKKAPTNIVDNMRNNYNQLDSKIKKLKSEIDLLK